MAKKPKLTEAEIHVMIVSDSCKDFDPEFTFRPTDVDPTAF